jgi:TolB-like protein/Tfp pilus assembly protein PilF
MSSELVQGSELETETLRGMTVIVEEEDDQPEIVRAAVSQLVSGRHRSPWIGPLLLIGAVLVIVGGLFAYSRRPLRANAGATEPIRSIAVLPLKNLTGDPANDYFSDGLTEGLITSLSKIETLSVQSRSSVFRFKNKEIDPQELGKQLGVAAVLEGGVRKSGDSVRMAVRLVSVVDGRVLWVSDSQDRALGDIFALQDDISRNVAAGLKLRLTTDADRQIARRYTDNIEAYQLYLQGRFFLTRYLVYEDLVQAVKHFEAAIAKDPNYALAYTGLADTYTMMGIDWRSPKEVFPKALEYSRRALELDEGLGEAHYSNGAVAYFYEWDWPKAQTELQRALDLNAKSLESNACYLHSLESSGKPDEATAEVRRALNQNPLSPIISAELGCSAYYARHYDQAIEFSDETLRLDHTSVFARYNTARAMGQKQMNEQALVELHKVGEVWGPSATLQAELGYNYAFLGRKVEARKILNQLLARSTKEYIDPYPLAFIYLALGEKDQALKALEQAFEKRSAWMPWLKVEPKFDPIRSEPRFNELLRRLKI